jgi:hypothetical protein
MTVTRDPSTLPPVGASIRIDIPDGVTRRPLRVVSVALCEEDDDGDDYAPPIHVVHGTDLATGRPVVEHLTSGDVWLAV